MSGGFFSYNQYRIGEIVEQIQETIDKNGLKLDEDLIKENQKWHGKDYYERFPEELYHYKYPDNVIEKFKEAVDILKKAEIYAQRIDWLLSGDDGEESFFTRLEEDLKEINHIHLSNSEMDSKIQDINLKEATMIDDWLDEHGDPEIYKKVEKQLELEEAAERLSKNAYKKHSVKDDTLSLDEQIQRSGGFIVGFKEGFIAGAKWQSEKMYSEEDLLGAFEAGMMFIGEDKGSFREWFEQFKKK